MRLAIRQSPGKRFDPSLPGLTRQSIFFFEKRGYEDRWMPGSSPGMTPSAWPASRL
jgi:hypothetical protein